MKNADSVFWKAARPVFAAFAALPLLALASCAAPETAEEDEFQPLGSSYPDPMVKQAQRQEAQSRVMRSQIP